MLMIYMREYVEISINGRNHDKTGWVVKEKGKREMNMKNKKKRGGGGDQ